MRRTAWRAAALAAALGLAAAARGEDAMKLTQADSGAVRTMNAGQGLVVRLDGSPGTGYSWEVLSVDTNILHAAGAPAIESGGAMPGASGAWVFRFVAAGAGRTSLRLGYRRPFEKDKPPARLFEANVTVRPPSP